VLRDGQGRSELAVFSKTLAYNLTNIGRIGYAKGFKPDVALQPVAEVAKTSVISAHFRVLSSRFMLPENTRRRDPMRFNRTYPKSWRLRLRALRIHE
jgi:hypothetical protein